MNNMIVADGTCEFKIQLTLPVMAQVLEILVKVQFKGTRFYNEKMVFHKTDLTCLVSLDL